MALPRTEDTKLGAQALAYQELTVENGAPTLGSQNQAVEFIRSDAELRRAVAAWAETVNIDERQWRRDGTCRLICFTAGHALTIEQTTAPAVFR